MKITAGSTNIFTRSFDPLNPMWMRPRKNVILFLTDKESDPTIGNFNHLQESTATIGGAYFLFHQKTEFLPVQLKEVKPFAFTYESLTALNYLPISEKLIPGNNHFPVLKFFLTHPQFDFYWVLEDDVRFNGDWGCFFSFFDSTGHDFISSHLRRYRDEPEWAWWRSLWKSDETIPFEQQIRSFNPIYRISRPALRFIHRALSAHWIGHHEVLLPTLLHHNGFKIADFGGNGEFVSAGNENLFYTSEGYDQEGKLMEGTMRFRPVWEKVGTEINKLYHPVKLNQPA